MSAADKSMTSRKDQIEALIDAKLDVQNKLNEIFSDERERLTEALENMTRIDCELAAQALIVSMHEVISPLGKEAQTELLEQIWTAVQDEDNKWVEEANTTWSDDVHQHGEPPAEGVA